MAEDTDIREFLSNYDDGVFRNTLRLRSVLLKCLPDIREQLDRPARMIAYCYGQKYSELVCTLIPSKKGLKLGFYKGVDLPDPDNLLKGNGKNSRYVEIKSIDDVDPSALQALIMAAFAAYRARNGK